MPKKKPPSKLKLRPWQGAKDKLGRRISPRRLRQWNLWRSRGGDARASKLSPQTRQEIARLGYQAMLRKRCTAILEAALFGIDPTKGEGVE